MRTKHDHPQSLLNELIREFNRRFRVAETESQKIVVLRLLAASRIHQWTGMHRGRRQKFDALGLRPQKACRVCGRFANVLHHIVTLRNGGTNDRRNLIELCHECHCMVHPWMENRVEERIPEEIRQHMREICSGW